VTPFPVLTAAVAPQDTATVPSPNPTTTPLTMTSVPTATPADGSPWGIESELTQIDQLLEQRVDGAIAYNTPPQMRLGETVRLQLLISPALSSDELEQLITEAGPTVTSGMHLTSKMRAVLSSNSDVFEIETLHDDSDQLISTLEPTEWLWLIKANKRGLHTLNLTIYRVIAYEGREYSRIVKSYESNILVSVTVSQIFQLLDRNLLIGGLLFLLSIMSFGLYSLYSRHARHTNSPGVPNTGSAASMRELRLRIDRHLNDSELRSLCFDLAIDYDKLPGTGKEDKVRELVAYCVRSDRLPELVALCSDLRPLVVWQDEFV
jgi:hypothetical protein